MIFVAIFLPDKNKIITVNENLEVKTETDTVLKEILEKKNDYYIIEDPSDYYTIFINTKVLSKYFRKKRIDIEKIAGKIFINGKEIMKNEYNIFSKLKDAIEELKVLPDEEEILEEMTENVEDIVEEKATKKQLNLYTFIIILLLITNIAVTVFTNNNNKAILNNVEFNLIQKTMKMVKLSNEAILTKLNKIEKNQEEIFNQTSKIDIAIENQKILNKNLAIDYNSIAKALNNHSKVLGIIANSVLDQNNRMIELEMLITKYLKKTNNQNIVTEVKEKIKKNTQNIDQQYQQLLNQINQLEKQAK